MIYIPTFGIVYVKDMSINDLIVLQDRFESRGIEMDTTRMHR